MKRNNSHRAGFVLIEVMLGVAIFALGVLALGACVNNCITAEVVRQETERATLALANRMDEIEAGSIPIDKEREDDLTDEGSPGMKLKQSRQPLQEKNEKGQDIVGLYQMNIEVDWTADNQPQTKSLTFYVLRSQ
jgi:prepilin-type N-terminal cleavage/methylation domain-containing protein